MPLVGFGCLELFLYGLKMLELKFLLLIKPRHRMEKTDFCQIMVNLMTFLASRFSRAEWTMVMMPISGLLQMLLLMMNRNLVMLMMVMESSKGDGRFQCFILDVNNIDLNSNLQNIHTSDDFYLVVCWILWNEYNKNIVERRHITMFLPLLDITQIKR